MTATQEAAALRRGGAGRRRCGKMRENKLCARTIIYKFMLLLYTHFYAAVDDLKRNSIVITMKIITRACVFALIGHHAT